MTSEKGKAQTKVECWNVGKLESWKVGSKKPTNQQTNSPTFHLGVVGAQYLILKI